MNEIDKRLASIEDRLQDIDDSLAILTARAEDPSDHVTLDEMKEAIKNGAGELSPVLWGPRTYSKTAGDYGE